MLKSINIDISGIESNILASIEQGSNSSNIKVINQDDKKAIQLNFSESFNEDYLLEALNGFLTKFKEQKDYMLAPSWFFNDLDLVIKSPNMIYSLTSKEAIFLKTLLKKRRTLKYTEMLNVIWNDEKDVSKNAIRLFTRNLRKKLPPNILKNLQGIGYRLDI